MKKAPSKYLFIVFGFTAILLIIVLINIQNDQTRNSQVSTQPQPTNTRTNLTTTKNNWKVYSFKGVGISFSAPADLNVSGTQTDKSSFIITAQRGKYPEKEYYQLYGIYNLAAKEVAPDDLKKDLKASSAQETTIGGFTSVSGQYKGDRNRFVTYIITDKGLLTLATSQPTNENKALTDTILKTFTFE